MATKKEEPKKEEAEDEEGGKKKGGKKKLIILIVLVLFILGGAGGGWFWWQKKKAAEEENAEEEEQPVKKKKKSSKKEEVAPVFVQLDTFTVNLQGEEGQFLQTVITLHMVDEEDANKLKQNMPLVKSRIVMLLSSKHAEELLSMEGKNKLAQEIADQIKQPFAQGDYPLELNAVLFTSFIIQ